MYDILIKQATIIDGTGESGWVGDVGVKNGRFTTIEPSIKSINAKQTIQGAGLILAPGFIDIHTHSDDYWLQDPRSEIKLKQGVTMDVVGNCGISLVPLEAKKKTMALAEALIPLENHNQFKDDFSFNDYRELIEKKQLAINMMGFVGHGTLRIAAMGFSEKVPDAGQMEQMKSLLGSAMDQGALGMSTGLIYAPGIFAKTPELVELSRVVAERDGLYASHIRNEAEEVLAAIDEVIAIGEQAQVVVHISHLKITGHKNWGLADQVIEKILAARAKGIDLTCDVYPYFSSRTSLTALIPPWAIEGGVEKLTLRLQDATLKAKIIHDIKSGIPGWENMFHNAGWEKITISEIPSIENKEIEGQTVAEIAQKRESDPFELILELIKQDGNGIKIISETMNEDNVAQFIQQPFAMIGSDSGFSQGKPHPRLYGAFPRVIRRFVRELKVLSMEEAIHKMSGMTARRLNLQDTGLIKKGFRADAVLFDPQTFSDTATYRDPCRFPEGLQTVMVNGVVVIEGSDHTGAAPGILHRGLA